MNGFSLHHLCFTSLDHPVYENTARAKQTSKSLRFSDLGGGAADLQKRQNFGLQIPRSRYINETRSEAIFFLSVGDPPADPLRSQKTLRILTCDLRVLVFDTQNGAETPQNDQCTRFDLLKHTNALRHVDDANRNRLM